MSTIERHYVIYAPEWEVEYRIEPNVEVGFGSYSDGASLRMHEDDRTVARAEIAPDHIAAVGAALLMASDDGLQHGLRVLAGLAEPDGRESTAARRILEMMGDRDA